MIIPKCTTTARAGGRGILSATLLLSRDCSGGKKMKRIFGCCAIAVLLGVAGFALNTAVQETGKQEPQSEKHETGKAAERAEQAAQVLKEITSAPDKGIPGSVVGKANCVIVIPGVK